MHDKNTRLSLRGAWKNWSGDSKNIKNRAILRLIRNQERKQHEAISNFKFNSIIFGYRALVSRMQGAIKLRDILRKRYKQIMKHRYTRWKQDELIHRKRLMRKYLMKIMFNTSIGYQIGFWRFKYIIDKYGTALYPKHSMMYKRLDKTITQCNRRYMQLAFFKIVLSFRTSPLTTGERSTYAVAIKHLQQAGARMTGSPIPSRPTTGYLDAQISLPLPISRASLAEDIEDPSNLATVAAGKLEQDELSAVN